MSTNEVSWDVTTLPTRFTASGALTFDGRTFDGSASASTPEKALKKLRRRLTTVASGPDVCDLCGDPVVVA